MAAVFIKLYPENPDPRKISQVIDVLQKGGVIIYPTDTVYGMGCDIFNQKAIERIGLIKGVKPKKEHFSFICYDLSNISEYTRSLSTPVFKLMKKALPGPFTFILAANNKVPKLLNSKKKTVGIRVPDHSIPRLLVKELGQPILTTSIRDEDDVIEYSTDPELIYEKYKDLVDVVIDGGYGNNVASTVVDCSSDQIEVIREGLGEISEIM
ncbi:L-threonylcarbamoyladenylate synthase [Cyclobacterium marinum]|uniref:Sua5/YciO/YrdC/YwlC family protein n=1 Tax=Cyclobacterium marinum (strain ATCC 25205 / DSM 745 / LMG 13164 / NCIMB 1802) TaxID=880070 RepID=G0J2S1_CYCMS|nr:L-threonylcarbamoyladenylate synthase [Cyclobacterium marinum]AEL26654.1 Sua5/YciO/YrdC/YwlC family protein [Cyclobacterium marinum DSM 745]MBI0400005.1 threonylcarbamoyl-AMP synthase [Cyclobacterium marinum]|tara:strand:- start:76970 stop:77599 length:630 start_codon:yes stop_codon:yes gene_type:complete